MLLILGFLFKGVYKDIFKDETYGLITLLVIYYLFLLKKKLGNPSRFFIFVCLTTPFFHIIKRIFIQTDETVNKTKRLKQKRRKLWIGLLILLHSMD